MLDKKVSDDEFALASKPKFKAFKGNKGDSNNDTIVNSPILARKRRKKSVEPKSKEIISDSDADGSKGGNDNDPEFAELTSEEKA